MKRIVFMGTPDFSVPALGQLIMSGHKLVAVYTRPDKPSGRGRNRGFGPVKQLALDHNIPVYQPGTLKDRAEAERMAGLSPDAIIVVAYGQIIPQEILDIPVFGCLNIHPSLLPRYRGASPVASAILAGETETGVTIMLLDSGTDTGPVLAQKRISIEPEDTTASLELGLAEAGAKLLIETLPKWFEQKIAPQRQNNREAINTRQISKNDGELDWHVSADELCRQIRAYHPWPGSYTRWNEKTLKIIQALPLFSSHEVEPGLVVSLPDEAPVPAGIGTGEGILGLIMVQMEGRKPVQIADFLRGQRGFIGEKIG